MSRLRTPVLADDHVAGPPDAALTLLEYGDYECPFCQQAYYQVKQLQQALGAQLRFVFRNFPLSQVHPHALAAAEAAEAAEAAGGQDQFWEMHDTLYENQDALDLPSLLSYAESLGLDLRRLSSDLDNHTYLERVHRDFMSGVRSGVNGTPTFFINGMRHDGPFTFDALLEALHGGAPAYGF